MLQAFRILNTPSLYFMAKLLLEDKILLKNRDFTTFTASFIINLLKLSKKLNSLDLPSERPLNSYIKAATSMLSNLGDSAKS